MREKKLLGKNIWLHLASSTINWPSCQSRSTLKSMPSKHERGKLVGTIHNCHEFVERTERKLRQIGEKVTEVKMSGLQTV